MARSSAKAAVSAPAWRCKFGLKMASPFIAMAGLARSSRVATGDVKVGKVCGRSLGKECGKEVDAVHVIEGKFVSYADDDEKEEHAEKEEEDDERRRGETKGMQSSAPSPRAEEEVVDRGW